VIGNGVAKLSCQELVELVTDYFEGALSWRQRRQFEKHLSKCDGCTTYLEQMRATIELAGASADLERRPEVSGLLEAFRDWKR
jgi:anti-sigma factor RsiW